jgi:hypothetical protein
VATSRIATKIATMLASTSTKAIVAVIVLTVAPTHTHTHSLTHTHRSTHVRESHARELVARPIHPIIVEGELPEYLTHLDNVQVEPTPITLPNLPALGPSPSASRQNKCSRVNLKGE